MVPLTVKIKERQAKRLGIAWEDFTFTDNALSYKDGSATPQGTPEEILAAGKKMYEELSPETRDFIHLMFDNELFDVLAKDGKAPGGYCTSLPDYQCPLSSPTSTAPPATWTCSPTRRATPSRTSSPARPWRCGR